MWFMKFGQQFNFEVLCSLTLSREAAFFWKDDFLFYFHSNGWTWKCDNFVWYKKAVTLGFPSTIKMLISGSKNSSCHFLKLLNQIQIYESTEWCSRLQRTDVKNSFFNDLWTWYKQVRSFNIGKHHSELGAV